jgi:hypothetical protein
MSGASGQSFCSLWAKAGFPGPRSDVRQVEEGRMSGLQGPDVRAGAPPFGEVLEVGAGFLAPLAGYPAAEAGAAAPRAGCPGRGPDVRRRIGGGISPARSSGGRGRPRAGRRGAAAAGRGRARGGAGRRRRAAAARGTARDGDGRGGRGRARGGAAARPSAGQGGAARRRGRGGPAAREEMAGAGDEGEGARSCERAGAGAGEEPKHLIPC